MVPKWELIIHLEENSQMVEFKEENCTHNRRELPMNIYISREIRFHKQLGLHSNIIILFIY